jgi:hypothetical protein
METGAPAGYAIPADCAVRALMLPAFLIQQYINRNLYIVILFRSVA